MEIGSRYVMFGLLLLEDATGSKVQNIAHQHRNDSEKINMEILQRWIDGRGKLPVTWQTLTDVLRYCNLSELAAEIEAMKVVES